MELQTPLVQRTLDEHPQVEFHVWNMARNRLDALYLQTLRGHRIKVFNDFYHRATVKYRDVYRWYASKAAYKNHLFVKFDDDVVFFQTDRFTDFIEAVDTNRGSVVSAKTINNGASTPLEPRLFALFEELDIPLLDVHLHQDFAELAHDYFFAHHAEILAQPVGLVPTQDWLSINAVGFDFATMTRLAKLIGGPAPRHIAGRNWGPKDLLGDEGACNMLPRLVLQGFVAAHLAFGPQKPGFEQLSAWRQQYGVIGRDHLRSPLSAAIA